MAKNTNTNKQIREKYCTEVTNNQQTHSRVLINEYYKRLAPNNGCFFSSLSERGLKIERGEVKGNKEEERKI